jgi:hypothetical protein
VRVQQCGESLVIACLRGADERVLVRNPIHI